MKKEVFIILMTAMITILSMNFIIGIATDKQKTIDRIRKEIQVEDVEMTEDGILIQLNVDGELDYYYFEDEVNFELEIEE